MSASDFVLVSLVISLSRAIQTQVFNVPMVCAYHTHNPDRIRYYSTSGLAAALVADGFSPNEAAYKAASTIAEQSPNVPQIAIGRRATKPLQTLTLTIGDATTGNIVGFAVMGSDGASHTIAYTVPSASTTASVATAVAALINGISGASTTIGTVTAAASVITIARTDGLLTDIQGWIAQCTVQNAVALANTTADPGIATDLAAITAIDGLGWYAIVLDSNSTAEITAAAAYAEATGQGGKYLFVDSSDAPNVTSATSDIFSVLESRSYKRTFLEQNNSQLLSYAGAGICGRALALFPGSYTLAYLSVAGPPADTERTLSTTQAKILNTASTSSPGNGGKNGNFYKTVNGANITWPGCAPSGDYVDFIIFCDWFEVNAQAAIFNRLIGQNKVPMTDYGIGLLKDDVKNVILTGGKPPYGGIDLTEPYDVTAPKAASLTPTQRATRNLPGLGCFFTYSSAIQTVQLQVQVTP